MKIEESDLVAALKERGYEWLPASPLHPKHLLAAASRIGNILFLSGQVPVRDGEVVFKGRVGREFTFEEVGMASELAMLNCFYAAGAIAKPEEIVRFADLLVFVRTAPDFDLDQLSHIADGACRLLVDIFGRDQLPSRTAIRADGLPYGAVIEIKATVELR